MTVQGQKRNQELKLESIVKMRGVRGVGGGKGGKDDTGEEKNINKF